MWLPTVRPLQELCHGLSNTTMVSVSPSSLQMERYPRLRDEVESLLMSFLREQEQKCKEHVQLMIEVELSYMNTNHPDFIGYHKLVDGRTGR